MRAIDTNVVVRFLTADDARQARAARRAIESGDIFVAITVFLETEWVLRSGYQFSTDEIVRGLRGFAGLPAISVEDPPVLAQALDWMEAGMDFADALHLAKSGHCDAFLTFDRKLVNAAKNLSSVAVELP